MVHAQAAHMINIYKLGNQEMDLEPVTNGNGVFSDSASNSGSAYSALHNGDDDTDLSTDALSPRSAASNESTNTVDNDDSHLMSINLTSGSPHDIYIYNHLNGHYNRSTANEVNESQSSSSNNSPVPETQELATTVGTAQVCTVRTLHIEAASTAAELVRMPITTGLANGTIPI